MQETTAWSKAAVAVPAPGARALRWGLVLAVVAGVAAVGLAIGTDFPGGWNLDLQERTDDFEKWVIQNRVDHPAFVYFFRPVTDGLDAALRWVDDFLSGLTWIGLVVAGAVIAGLAAGWRMAVGAAGGLFLLGLLGVWDQSVDTLALMGVSVAISLAIGIPLGIAAGLSNRLESALRPVLDAMQTMPAYVYLLPVVLFFSIGDPAALISTVIFALPPAVRVTALGIREVPKTSVEVGTSFGCTRWQLLRKVQLPLAKPAIMLGVNQTIMMALGMVVIAALVGSGGLGREVMRGLQTLDVGRALAPGLAIVVLAIVLDRVSHAWSQRDRTRHARRGARGPAVLDEPWGRRGLALAGLLVVVGAVALGRSVGLDQFPESWNLSIRGPVNAAVDWMSRNLHSGLPVIGGTGAISDFLTLYWLNPLRDFLQGLSWWMVVLGTAALALWLADLRVALVSAAALVLTGLLGVWDQGMDTLSQVFVAVALAIAIAIPLGILAARSDTFDRVLRPILDAMQTMPAFVYLVPVIALFNVGRVPGLIASVVYALPPGIRLTNLGLRQVPKETVEAAVSFGATPWQLLRKVQLPLAKPSIMLGINQTIMMTLSMVIIAGLIGSGALGLEVVFGLTHAEIGRGVAAGVSIVLLAVILDRITQQMGRRDPGQVRFTWVRWGGLGARARRRSEAGHGTDDGTKGGGIGRDIR